MTGDVERGALRLALVLASLSPLSVGLMGMTRGAAWLGGGEPPAWPHRAALALELGVAPALALWQARVARRARAGRRG